MANNNNSGGFEMITLSSYTAPVICELTNEDYVHYGEDNNYFEEIINYYMGSVTNGSLINSVSKLIYGKGLDAKDKAKKPDQYAKMLSMVSPKVLKRVILDRKMLGMAALQVSYSKGKPSKITHFPMNTLRASKSNENGEIESWGYSSNWSEVKPNDKVKSIPAFGFGNKKGNEIYIVKDYTPSFFYYTPPDYAQALPYAKLEEEIGDYLINDTINGFSGNTLVNFNNGVPSAKIQRELKNKVHQQLTGATGTKVMVNFNKSGETATTLERFTPDNAPDHYQYLSDECRNKLLMGHRISNPLLVGIKDGGSGLSNNSDEIETAFRLQSNTVIKPYQDELTEALEEIMSLAGITLDLYFKALQPLGEYDGEIVEEVVEEIVENIEETEETEETKLSEEINDTSSNPIPDSNAINTEETVEGELEPSAN